MSAFLVAYLDAIDERLLEYLDDDDELTLYAVHRLRLYASELRTGLITPAHLIEGWPDWFPLVEAFVAAYASDLYELEESAPFLAALEEIPQGDTVVLADGDRAYLADLESRLDMYPELRNVGDDEAGE